MGNFGRGMGLALHWTHNRVQMVWSLKLLKIDDAEYRIPIRQSLMRIFAPTQLLPLSNFLFPVPAKLHLHSCLFSKCGASGIKAFLFVLPFFPDFLAFYTHFLLILQTKLSSLLLFHSGFFFIQYGGSYLSIQTWTPIIISSKQPPPFPLGGSESSILIPYR